MLSIRRRGRGRFHRCRASRRGCAWGRDRWFNLLWLLPVGFALLIVAVAVAKGLRNLPAVERFIARYPGTITTARDTTAPGFPVWVGVQHFFNLFLLIFVIRSGLQILSDHPRLYWTRHSTPGKDWFRIQKPVPDEPLWTAKQDSISLPRQVGLPGIRHSIGLAAVVAPGNRRSLAAQWSRLLCVVVHDFSVASRRADHVGGISQRAFGADPVLVAALADRERMGGLQRASTARVLHHDLRRRTACSHHRARHVSGALDALPADQPGFEHSDRTISAFLRVRLVPRVHRESRRARVHHWAAQQSQPHLCHSQRRQLDRLRRSSRRRWS